MTVVGAVYGTNSVPVYVDDLENLMKDCTKLMGKPKILIIQACQGQTQQDGESNLEKYVVFNIYVHLHLVCSYKKLTLLAQHINMDRNLLFNDV
jgi:hypothetical protein